MDNISQLPTYDIEQLRALQAEVQKVFKYPGEGRSADTCLVGWGDLTYFQGAQILSQQPDPQLRAAGYWAAGRCLKKDQTLKFIDGRLIKERDIYVEAIKVNPKSPFAYNGIGYTMTKGTTFTLPDGRSLDVTQMFVEALSLDSNYTQAYYNLGCMLVDEEQAKLSDGRVVYKDDLFLLALRSDSCCWYAYSGLAVGLKSYAATVTLPDGRALNKQALYLEALRIEPRDSFSLSNLAAILPPDGTATLANGRTLTKHQLYLEALTHNPEYGPALRNLRASMRPADCWSRPCHSLLFNKRANVLFATLLLGLQRLETAGLPQAHHSMLEDMLEGWTWADECRKIPKVPAL